MFPDELQDAPLQTVLIGSVHERLVDGMRMLGSLFVHAATAVDIMDEDEAAGVARDLTTLTRPTPDH